MSCLLTRPVTWDGSPAGGATRRGHTSIDGDIGRSTGGATLPPRSALREQIPIVVSELTDQYLMQSVTWASSSPTAKAASLNRRRLITARIHLTTRSLRSGSRQNRCRDGYYCFRVIGANSVGARCQARRIILATVTAAARLWPKRLAQCPSPRPPHHPDAGHGSIR